MGRSERHAPSAATCQERVAKTKTLILFIEILSCTGDGDWRTNPLWPEGRRGLRNGFKFPIAEFLKIYAQRASSIPSGCLPERRHRWTTPLITSYDENPTP